MSDLGRVATAWMDPWWDEDAGLLWNPPGAFEDVFAEPRSAHLVLHSAWYAVGLLERGDVERAVAALTAVCEQQLIGPGARWHGTFRRFAEEPDPGPDAIEWIHFDPNWRQFVGTTLLLVLERFGSQLPAASVERFEAAVRLAVDGEPPDRVDAGYSNIALMKAWLEVAAGERFGDQAAVERGLALADAIGERFHRWGAFEEYNSPTYYGVDLYALGLWRRNDALRGAGERIEAELWRDVARFYHAGLRNLAGPYTRAYGMDMTRYGALLGLWVWEAEGQQHAPFPDPGQTFPHAHDLCAGPAVTLLGSRIPADVRRHFVSFAGERLVERNLGDDRVATAWLSEDVMCGAERGTGWGAWYQYHPATAHWRLPGTGVGTIRVTSPAPVDATAAPSTLDIVCREHGTDGRQVTSFRIEAPQRDIRADRWSLPGLSVHVDTNARFVGEEGDEVRYEPAPGPQDTRFLLGFTPEVADSV